MSGFCIELVFAAILEGRDETRLDRELPVGGNPVFRWKNREDDALIEAVQEHGRNWVRVAAELDDPNFTPKVCRERYAVVHGMKHQGPWSALEDARLLQGVKKYGENWSTVARLLNGRDGRQVRKRYSRIKVKLHRKDVKNTEMKRQDSRVEPDHAVDYAGEETKDDYAEKKNDDMTLLRPINWERYFYNPEEANTREELEPPDDPSSKQAYSV